MQLLVSDANILIDFEEGGLLADLFRLRVTLTIPDVLFAEELEERHSHYLDLGLKIRSLTAASVERALGLAETYRRASRNDLLALALAEQESCPLLTGDAALREAAETERVEVHGTLWLAERLVEEKIVELTMLETAYEAMREAGRRLPWVEVERQLKRLAG